MPKLNLHYVIINGQDGGASTGFYADEKSAQLATEIEENAGAPFCENGPHETELEFDSKGRLLNPDNTVEGLRRTLAEMRGEEEEMDEDADDAAPHRTTPAAANAPENKGSIWYVIRNCGDGSAAVDFYADAESAQLATEIEEEGGEAFGDNPHSQSFRFDAKGALLNPDSTYAELKAERAEQQGDDVDDETDEDADDSLTSDFNSAADIAGKNIVFTGKLSEMTRGEAERTAAAMGAKPGSTVTGKTDLLVAGEDAGSKLDKARDLGIPVISDAQWNAIAKKSRGPGP